MKIQTEEEPPPRPADLEAWRAAIIDGSYRTLKMEAVIAAIQELGPKADKSVINPLILHAAESILRVLRRYVGTNHRNQGQDIVEAAHGLLVEAILKPDSADGKGMREAFVPRIRFRAADAIREDKKTRNRECTVENIHEVADERLRPDIDPQQELDEKLDVEAVLMSVTDERKRLAFRLHMDGIPLDSKRTVSISKAVGVSAKTAGQWIEEVQAQLKHIVGEQS